MIALHDALHSNYEIFQDYLLCVELIDMKNLVQWKQDHLLGIRSKRLTVHTLLVQWQLLLLSDKTRIGLMSDDRR